jgi:hypothetical protein
MKLINFSKQLCVFTYTNLLTNGNFVDTTGWGVNNSAISASNNILSVTGNGGGAYPEANKSTLTACATGKKLYVACLAQVTNSSALNIFTVIQGTTGGQQVAKNQTVPTIDTWYKLTGIVTLTAVETGNIKFVIYPRYADAATANGKVMKVKEVLVVDLTTMFGSGNEPSTGDCDNIFNFIDDLKQADFSKTLLV